MPKKTSIKFNYLHPAITLKERNRLKKFLVYLLNCEGKKAGTINIIFCTDKYLLKVNQGFLKHNYYTDIITFDLSTRASSKIDSDIFISYDRVKENAFIVNNTIKLELHRVLFHGFLHLCGYKDKSEKDIKIMRNKEDQYLSLYFS